MIDEYPSSSLPVNGESQDDIHVLSDVFSLQNWHYVDIAREERLAEILTRWPLLAEFVSDININEGQ